jgi:hypothetical protein
MDGRRSIGCLLGNSSRVFDVDRGGGCCDPGHRDAECAATLSPKISKSCLDRHSISSIWIQRWLRLARKALEKTRQALGSGMGINKVARRVGLSNSTVARLKAETVASA